MVICLFPAQAKLLQSSGSFEVDMAYKRVKDSGIREVVFAKLMREHGQGKRYLTDVYQRSTGLTQTI